MDVKSKPRRRHSAQFKAEVIAACSEPGASVAAIARRFDLNDNLVHQWRRGRGASTAASEPSDPIAGRPMEFVAMSLPAPVPNAPQSPSTVVEPIRVEIRRGSATVNVAWPSTAAGDCAAWLRELLR